MRISDWSSDVCSSDLVEATIAIGMASVFILMVFGNPIWALVIGGALLMAARLIVRSDYNMFKILFLFGRTKASAPNKGVWGGSSFSPLPVAGVMRTGFARVYDQGADRKSTRLNSSH